MNWLSFALGWLAASTFILLGLLGGYALRRAWDRRHDYVDTSAYVEAHHPEFFASAPPAPAPRRQRAAGRAA